MVNWNSVFASQWMSRAPASESAIRTLRAAIPFQLSGEYVEMLRWSNGGEGQPGEVYLSIWAVEDVARLNEGYLIQQAMPTVLAIADDSAHFYGFDYALSGPAVIRFPIGFVSPSKIDAREPDLKQMLTGLATKRLY